MITLVSKRLIATQRGHGKRALKRDRFVKIDGATKVSIGISWTGQAH